MKDSEIPLREVPERTFLFLLGLVNAVGGITLAWVLSRRTHDAIGPFSVALCALGLVAVTKALFERHRDQSWHGKGAEGASTELGLDLLSVQLGIFVGFQLLAAILPRPLVEELFGFQMRGIFAHRFLASGPTASIFASVLLSGFSVACVTLLLGAVYKEGGIALALAWNGSLLGVAMVQIVRLPGIRPVQVLCLLASLLAAALAYHAAGMVGLFLSRGAQKYRVRSVEFHGIARTALLLYGTLVALVLASAAFTALAGPVLAR